MSLNQGDFARSADPGTEEAAAGGFFSHKRHREVLQNCLDVPGQCPAFPFPLDAVGISAKTAWVRLPQGRLPFDLRLEVELAADRRGIHMSRLEEAISALYDRDFIDLRGYALALARLAVPGQESRRGRIALAGQLPRPSRTLISGRNSLDALDLRVEVEAENSGAAWRWRVGLVVGVHHITACPCTQAYNQLLLAPAAASPPEAQREGPCFPLPTHSQRSHTTLGIFVEHDDPVGPGELNQENLLACLASALHLSQDLLKRPDEAELVYASHAHPQFAEDSVRETARAAATILGPLLPPASRVVINTVGLESIHRHDVHCRLETTLAAIAARLPDAPGE